MGEQSNYQREYYQTHKDEIKKQKAEYNVKNRERINKRQREYTKNNLEKVKASQKKTNVKRKKEIKEYNTNYYKTHKEKMNSDNKKYRQENRVVLNKKKTEWVIKNPKKRAMYSHNYQQNNPEATLQRQIKFLTKIGKVHDMNYYETKLGLSTWSKSVKKRDGYACVNCGDSVRKIEAHHIKPKIDYPELMFELDNGKTVCDICHYREHGKLGGVEGN